MIKFSPTLRSLSADGKIRIPYDSDAINTLRTFPEAKWNPAEKVWKVSTKPQHRKKVLELAEKLGLDIAPELRVAPPSKELQEEINKAEERAKQLKLFPYQIEGVKWLVSRQKAILADSMGLGKSSSSLCSLPEGAKTLIVCPASLKWNWYDEVQKWRSDFTPIVIDKKENFRLPEKGEVIIVNYDILPGEIEETKAGKRIKKGSVPDCKEIHLIGDEGQKLKSTKTKRSKRFAALSKTALKVYILTGTPLQNHLQDLYGVLMAAQLLKEMCGSYQNFLKLCNAKKNFFGQIEYGKPTPQLSQNLKRVMIQRKKEEVFTQLPEKRYQTIKVDVDAVKLMKELDSEWEATKENLKELPDFSKFATIRAKIAESRIDSMLELIEDYEESETPLIVFSAHKKPIQALDGRKGWATITGDNTTPEERQEIVRKFKSGEIKNGVAMTIAAGGVGLNFTRASACLFVDLDWVPANNVQAEARIDRIGQESKVLQIIRMVSNHPLDIHILKLLLEKMELVRLALGKSL